MKLKSGTVETGPNLCNEKPFPFLYLNCYNIYLITCGNLDYNIEVELNKYITMKIFRSVNTSFHPLRANKA